MSSAIEVEKKPSAPKPKKEKKTSKKTSKKAKTSKLTIRCSAPVEDEIFDIAAFEKFLHDRIKVDGKVGVLGDTVSIERDKNTLNLTVKNPFSKRYLKYLTKKFLKKQQLRDYIRVIATDKNSYDLKYFNIHNEEEQEAN